MLSIFAVSIVVFCLSSMAEIHSGLFFVFLPWEKYILVCFLSFFHGRSAPRREFGINLCDIYVDSDWGRLFFDVGNEVEDVVEEVAGCF